MINKHLKIPAILLILIFLALNVATELSHHHGQFTGEIRVTETADESQTNSFESHSLVCIACIFGLTQVAPALSYHKLKLEQNSTFSIYEEVTFLKVFLTTSYYLRAPPQAFA